VTEDSAKPAPGQPAEVSQATEADRAATVRTLTTVAELKALADPLRLAILVALTRGATVKLPILSVKELAAELGEPKTKLYRHIKQLEAAGLIRVAATRVVSGILEQRYQACQGDLSISAGVVHDPAAASEANAAVAAALDRYRTRYLAHLATLPASGPPEPPERRSMLLMTTKKVSPARAKAVRDRLKEVVAELDQSADDSPDAVSLEVLIGFLIPD
jgi:DNA-binding transcriptional ArsR family regulator